MSDITIQSIDTIISDPDVRGGRPIIAGTTLRVQDIVAGYLYKYYTVDQLLEHYPFLSYAQVHAALAYYYEHQELIDAHMKEDLEFANRAKEQGIGERHRLYFDESVEVAVAFIYRTAYGDWVAGLALICGAMSADEMQNHVEYL